MKTLLTILVLGFGLVGCGGAGGSKGGSSSGGGGSTLDQPTLVAADTNGAENSPLVFHAIGSDPQSKPLTYSCLNCTQTGMAFNTATGQLVWTPSYTQAGAYTLQLQVTNGTATATANPIITIAFTERPPTWNATIPTQNMNVGGSLTLTPTATSPQGDTISYAVTSGMPAQNATFSGNTFTFNPSAAQNGTYNVTFQATDQHATSITQTVQIVVGAAQPPTNNAPTTGTVNWNQALSFTVTGSANGDSGAITLAASGLPTGASFNTGTGAFSWTPACGFATGNYTVVFTVTDAFSGDQTVVDDVITVNALSCGNPTWSTNPSFTTGTGSATVGVAYGTGSSPNGAVTYGYAAVNYDCNNVAWSDNSGVPTITVTNTQWNTDAGTHWFLVYVQDSLGNRNYRNIQMTGYSGGSWTLGHTDQGTTHNTTGFCGGSTVYSHSP